MIVTPTPNDRVSPSEIGKALTLVDMPSHVLHNRSKQYFWEGVGVTSMKIFFKGRAFYRAGPGYHAVDNDSYLLLNHEQPYSIQIDSPEPTETFCLFFDKGFVEDAYRNLSNDTLQLLDEPVSASLAAPHFFERNYPHDAVLLPMLLRLRTSLKERGSEPGWLEEQLYAIYSRLLQIHQTTCKEVEQFPAARAATRAELYRRLHRARDFISASLHQSVTLRDISRAACLSPNHLLRTFKVAFRQTPHQYLTARRIEAAKKLLRNTDRTVTAICFDVGMESVGSFSWLFRRHVGVSPENYRRQKGDFREAGATSFSL